MNRINNIISSYQQKICKYDRQLWEQSYEKEVFQRLHRLPRKAAKVNTSLIDVDLFRGSAFSMSKSQHGWLSVATIAWFRLMFFPLYYKWWLHSTCSWIFILLSLLYTFQVGSFVVTFVSLTYSSEQSHNAETLTMADYMTPYIMMYSLAVLHSHIASNCSFPLRHSTNSKRGLVPQKKISDVDRMPSVEDAALSSNRKLSKPDLINSTAAANVSVDRNSLESSLRFVSSDRKPEPDVKHIALESSIRISDDLKKSVSEPMKGRIEKGVKEENWNLNRAGSESFRLNGLHGSEMRHRKLSQKSSVADSSLSSSAWNSSASTLVDVFAIVAPDAMVEGVLERLDCNDKTIAKETELSTKNESAPSRKSLELMFEEKASIVYGINNNDSEEEEEEIGSTLSNKISNFDDQSPDLISVADSNTSMSDTCNSSFMSSAEEEEEREREREIDMRGNEIPDCKKFEVQNVSSAFKIRPRRRALAKKQTSIATTTTQMTRSDERNLNDTSSRAQSFSKWPKDDPDAASSDEEDQIPSHIGILKSRFSQQSAIRRSSICRRRKTCSSEAAVDQTLLSVAKDDDSPSFISRRKESYDLDFAEVTQSLPQLIKNIPSECKDLVNKRLWCNKTFIQNSQDSSRSSKTASVNPVESGSSVYPVSSLINSLSSSTDKVSCMIWSSGGAVHKVDLTVLDIGWTIIQTVDGQQERCDYMILGILLSLVVMVTPSAYRLYHNMERDNHTTSSLNDNCSHHNSTHTTTTNNSYANLVFGNDWRQTVVLVDGLIQRLLLSLMFFFLLSVAERTFKQRLLYAKYFCYLTSSRKAKKYDLPHFRLNKVRNIKSWLSLRSFLKKRGPQRSVESVVSAAFILAVVLVSILCIELLRDYGHFLEELANWELVLWSMILGVYLLRFITLGTKINKKYRNLSVLITEQINLYLHMEQKPHKKEALMVANSVLKLAEDLLKELESPFKISGLSANPFLYNITKVVILSAFSAVLTELLGFKLKLYKIKIRS